jgi:hypothetical protein
MRHHKKPEGERSGIAQARRPTYTSSMTIFTTSPAAMLNFPKSDGGTWSSLSRQAPGGGAAAADSMARIKAKLDELDRVMLEGKQGRGIGEVGGLCV